MSKTLLWKYQAQNSGPQQDEGIVVGHLSDINSKMWWNPFTTCDFDW